MSNTARGPWALLLLGAMAAGMLAACATAGPMAPATAAQVGQSPLGPAAVLAADDLVRLTVAPTGPAPTGLAEVDPSAMPIDDVPQALADKIAGQIADEALADAPAGVDARVTTGVPGVGDQPTWGDTAISSNGAAISSQGYCGGGPTGFRVRSYGFEWIRFSVWSGTTYLVGGWMQVPQGYEVWIPLPIATPNVAYIVDGWDETPLGGDQRTVITSFLRVPDLTYRTWIC